MLHTDTSPIALFKQFQPKFREIQWEVCGLPLQANEGVAKFYLSPLTTVELRSAEEIHIDLKEAGICLPKLDYDATRDGNPIDWVGNAIWEAIKSDLFRDTKFYADPSSNDVERMFEERAPTANMRIVFSHSSDPIPGLHIPEKMYTNWTFFVPACSPEAKVIRAAIQLERTQKQFLREWPVEELTSQLESALAAVAT